MGLLIGLGVCFAMVCVYSMCMVAGQYDEAMEKDFIQAKKDRAGSASDSERDHE